MRICFLYLLTILFFSSCCCDRITPSFNTTESNWAPYKIGDTLRFKTPNGSERAGLVYDRREEDIESRCKKKGKRIIVSFRKILDVKFLPFSYLSVEKRQDSVHVQYESIFTRSQAKCCQTITAAGRQYTDVWVDLYGREDYRIIESYVSAQYGLIQFNGENTIDGEVYSLVKNSKL